MNQYSKILILGNSGELGHEIYEAFKTAGFQNLSGSHDDNGRRKINLRDAKETNTFLNLVAPEFIIMAAGGYRKMKFDNRCEIMLDNIEMDANIMRCAIAHQPHGLRVVYHCISEKDLKLKGYLMRIADELEGYTITCAKGPQGILARLLPQNPN